MFSNARTNEKNGKISNALLFYLQALMQLKDYVGEPLEVNLDGSNVFLINTIYSSIQYLLSNTELRANRPKRDGKIGQPLKKPLQVAAVFTDAGNREISVSNLPLHFAFIKGSGDLLKRVKTDRFGNAKARVTKITAPDKIQTIKTQLDMPGLISKDLPLILQNMVNNLSVPDTRFILNVVGPSAYIKVTETHFGKKANILYIEPKLKNALAEYGFTFVNNESKADIYIELKAASRKGSKMYDICSSYVDLTISVIDMALGDEVYKDAIQNIKGLDLNYDKAGIRAFEGAGKKVGASLKSALGIK
jgi:hypothetical protein